MKKAAYGFAAAALALCELAYLTGCSKAESAAPSVTDTLNWTMPTQYTDGTALPISAIAKTVVVWGATSGGPYSSTQDVAAPATTVALLRPNEGYGTRCYRVAVVTTPAEGGAQGAWSDEACKTVKAPPSAPTGLTVQ